MDEWTQEQQEYILELEQRRDRAVFEAQDWGFKLKAANEELERIKPLYRKFYSNPLFWLIRPLDAEFEDKVLMQCLGPPGPKATCFRLFWLKDDMQPGMHKSHMHGRATETSVWQYIKARCFPFLIPRGGDVKGPAAITGR